MMNRLMSLRQVVKTANIIRLPSLSQVRFAASSSSKEALLDEYKSHDKYYEEYKIPHGQPARRDFAYMMLGGARFVYASSIRLMVMKFVGSMSASADVLALASLEVSLDKVPLGQTVTVKWRGKPVFIKHRTPEEIADAKKVTISGLRDPQTDDARVQKDEWLIALGICTHLGCVPLANAGEYTGGWFCPCHGSHYDNSGRIRKGPAPLNLEIPPYKFIEGEDKILIG